MSRYINLIVYLMNVNFSKLSFISMISRLKAIPPAIMMLCQSSESVVQIRTIWLVHTVEHVRGIFLRILRVQVGICSYSSHLTIRKERKDSAQMSLSSEHVCCFALLHFIKMWYNFVLINKRFWIKYTSAL